MEEDKDGFAGNVRREKAKPTRNEDNEFAVLMIAMAIVMLCVFGMGVIGSAMMFWRIFG